MVNVPGWPDDELERLTSKLAAIVRRAWRTIARLISARLRSRTFVTQTGVSNITDEWMNAVENVIIENVREIFITAAESVIDATNAPVSALTTSDVIDTHLGKVRQRLRAIGDDVWQLTREQITIGVSAGESVPEIATRVQNVIGVSSGRANVIARTEVHAAHEAGAYQQVRALGLSGTKTWLATDDSRTRETHRLANGQTVSLDASFTVGDDELRFPGDPLGTPSETIMCRCSVAYDLNVDIISTVSDKLTSDNDDDDDDDALTAAGAWDPKEHPRGKNGKFIKRGTSLFTALTTSDADVFSKSIIDMTPDEWFMLTDDQKNDLVDKAHAFDTAKSTTTLQLALAKLQAYTTADQIAPVAPTTSTSVSNISAFKGAIVGTPAKITTALIWNKYDENTIILESSDGKTRVQWSGGKYLRQVKQPDGSWVTEQTWTKKDAYAALKSDTTWVVPGAHTASNSTFAKPSATITPNTSIASTSTSTIDITPSTATITTPIPTGMNGKPGDVAHFNTKVIWGKHANGQYIAVSPDGKKRIIWDDNQKKYLEQSYDEDIGAWQTGNIWTKKDAYSALKSDTTWVVPGAAPKIGVDTAASLKTSVLAPNTVPTPSPSMGAVKIAPDDWYAIANTSHAPGDVIAVTSDGKHRLVQDALSNVVLVQSRQFDGTWKTEKYVAKTGSTMDIGTTKFSDDWFSPSIGTPGGAQQLTDAQVHDGLVKLTTHVSLSADDIKALGHSITQAQWDVATPEQRKQLLKSVVSQPASTEISQIIDKLKSFALLTPPMTPAKTIDVATITPVAPTTPGLDAPWGPPGFTYADKKILEASAEDNSILSSEAVIYVKYMTLDDYSTLSNAQKINLTQTLAVSALTNASTMLKKLDDFAKTIGPVAPASSVPSVTTPPLASPIVSPTPVIPGTSATFTSLDDNVPAYVVTDLKSMLKTKNVGYWSTPEKIWDVLKDFQQKYPHPTEAGFSKYSPMGVLTALDQTTKAGGGSAYSSKLTKWATTPKGLTYIGKSGVMTSGLTPKIPAGPSVGAPTPAAPKMPSGLPDIGSGDISNITSKTATQIYADFKKKPNSFVTSAAKNIFENVKSVAEQHNITSLQALRVVDAIGAQKFGVNNEFIFEKKIVDWLATPKGTAVALGLPTPKPPTPAFSAGVDPNAQLPSLIESNKYTYETLSVTDATPWFTKVTDKYGQWKPAQSAGLRAYTGSAVCNAINPYLWGDLDDISATNAKHMKNTQAAMRPSLEPVLLHRGCDFVGIGDAKNHADVVKMIGQTWKADGFFSTSVGGAAAFGGNVMIEIEAPPGTPMAWAKSVSQYPSENEMLLAAGLTYHVVNVTQSSTGKTIMRVRVVPTVKE